MSHQQLLMIQLLNTVFIQMSLRQCVKIVLVIVQLQQLQQQLQVELLVIGELQMMILRTLNQHIILLQVLVNLVYLNGSSILTVSMLLMVIYVILIHHQQHQKIKIQTQLVLMIAVTQVVK